MTHRESFEMMLEAARISFESHDEAIIVDTDDGYVVEFYFTEDGDMESMLVVEE